MSSQSGSTINILSVTTYPPYECGIATFSQDLINVIGRSFGDSIDIKVCAISGKNSGETYSEPVSYTLNAGNRDAYLELAANINEDSDVDMVYLQHEFGLFGGNYGDYLLGLLLNLHKPFAICFHTVLPHPEQEMLKLVQVISKLAVKVVVMTQASLEILHREYDIPVSKLVRIPHGTHLTEWGDSHKIKQKHGLDNRLILSTFGLLSSNKSIETAIEAMDSIRMYFPNALYLVLGKTHPQILANEGEQYRRQLEEKVAELHLEDHVHFVNKYLSLKELLEYLSMTDVYLFTSKDPNQAVSGTFVYAMGSGCPIVSTPFLQARETLNENTGILVDFNDAAQLAAAAIRLLSDEPRRHNMSMNTYHATRDSIWENVAISYAHLFTELAGHSTPPRPSLPPVLTNHFRRLTDDTGMVQFAKICTPDLDSGYTLDDNARAMIAMCMHYRLKPVIKTLAAIRKYLDFILFCQQPGGKFLNYVDKEKQFTAQNKTVNLDDANTRAVWSLGILLSCQHLLPYSVVGPAEKALLSTLEWIGKLESPRAIAFSIKGLSFYLSSFKNPAAVELVIKLGNRLQDKYNETKAKDWNWYEKYLTYANAVLPEAMLYAYLHSGKKEHHDTATESLQFLCDRVFTENYMKVISNKGEYTINKASEFGEQSIDVCYTILALDLFYKTTGDKQYLEDMKMAFSWYLGNNHLHQIMYNPVSGGCFDGLEETHVNQNQGAESTVCYLIARLTMEESGQAARKSERSSLKVKYNRPSEIL
ncbi:glycosyltransferase involved in cell wall biosynthesis [Anseongella ginsenosidimutans]|uniref:Glycosyltransferase involved in cell wall biosynthesis n=1 Tax=Anseongella ginsenosidimutans TaxID=496056 RepID=A0A4R3KZ15_9SPHI|nr:glycosyltransferase [Anseongella ginsenosidimutans]QEC51434.1 glycosyltransferase [Anseongella ginsenosidimutans]TCS89860.1 glycosyltransferase involved in cell wall biosynthesis [Anseongella ginsenosidimutans]